jgi:hypothetical protein
MNATATYPEFSGYRQSTVRAVAMPVPPVAPFLVMGWGHLDERSAPMMVATLRGDAPVEVDDDERAAAAAYMQATYAARAVYWNDAMADVGVAVAESWATAAAPFAP